MGQAHDLAQCCWPSKERKVPACSSYLAFRYLACCSAATGGLTLEQQQAMLEKARQRAEAAAASGEGEASAGGCSCDPQQAGGLVSPLRSSAVLCCDYPLRPRLWAECGIHTSDCSCRRQAQGPGREGSPAHRQVRLARVLRFI